MPRLRLSPAVLLLSIAAGCRDAPHPGAAAPPAPAAEFVLAAGDSAFWVTSDSAGIHTRGAPLELVRLDGRFLELYVVDDDHSYAGADLIGQSVFKRDLRTGDSTLVFRDSLVPALAREYAKGHPDERPLGEGEEPDDEPELRATATIELGAAHGPFVSYSLHTDVERGASPLWHVSRRGVLDLRTGRPARLRDIAGEEAPRVEMQRETAARTVIDSLRRTHAGVALSHYRVDPASYAITTVDGGPAIAYAIPGSGHGDAGHMLPVPPIAIGQPAWWTDVAATLPTTSADGSRDVWRHRSYSVVVRYDSTGDAHLSLRDSTSREWKVGPVSSPATRIYWLDRPAFDGDTRHALARAFNEAASYGAEPGRVALARGSRLLSLVSR